MDNIAAHTMLNDFEKTKEKVDADTEVDIDIIIKTFSQYDQKDLQLFKDCIDLVLLIKDK